MSNIAADKNAIRLFYFSGTGNTQIIASRLAAKFKERGLSVTSEPIEACRAVSINGNDVIGLGFPIAAFTTYPVVFDFLKRLPDADHVPVFGFCTMGGASLWGIIDEVRTILIRKGYDPLGFSEFQMPLNIFLRLPEKTRKRFVTTGLEKADRYAEALIDGRTQWKQRMIGSKFLFLLATGLFKLTELKIHQKLFKIRVEHDKCTRCGICVKKCPTRNISLENRILIGDACQYCLRCVAVCPNDATFAVLTPKSFHYRAESSNL